MAKIDLDKLICSLAKRKYFSEEKLQDALKEQDLEYKDGEIVESQKPKFKVGDWVIDKQGIVHQIANVVENVTNHTYGYDIVGGGYFNDNTEGIRLWTIQDAKDGDVLACGDEVSDCPFIFHNLNKKLNPRSYCGVNTICDFQENDENGGSWCDSEEVRPATKEQRDFLFSKMHEAGYEWNADKKELKKIEKTRPMLSDFFNAEYERGKASFANRQLYNRAILAILSNYVEKYPDMRFGQMLFNLDIKPHFNQESRETYCNLKENINKKS